MSDTIMLLDEVETVKEAVPVEILPEKKAEAVVAPIVREAQLIRVTNPAENTVAAEFLKRVKATSKQVEGIFADPKKKAADAHKAICSKENELLKPLLTAEALVKGQLSAYAVAQERLRIEAERKAAEEAAALQIEAAVATESGDIDTAAEKQIAAATAMAEVAYKVAPPEKVSGVHTQKVKKWKIADISRIPAQYLIVNEKMVNAVVKTGGAGFAIPGIEIYEETIVVART